MKPAVLLCALITAGLALTPQTPAQPNQPKPKVIAVNVDFGRLAKTPALRFDAFMLKNVVVDPANPFLRLKQSQLLTDESGATDFHQVETLSATTQAKKIFSVTANDVNDGELFFYGTAKEVVVNGHSLKPTNLVSTGWSRVKLTYEQLKDGRNEIVFKGPGSLLLEPSKKPGHSFKSTDGGKTWSREGMTNKSNQEGEYLVRLRLKFTSSSGSATSQVFDLWQIGSDRIAEPRVLRYVVRDENSQFDDRKWSTVEAFIRFGTTPTPDLRNWSQWETVNEKWSDWVPLDKRGTPLSDENARRRWAQVKLELGSTRNHFTRRISEFRLHFEFVPDSLRLKDAYQVSYKPDTKHFLSSTPFVYQAPSPRLKHLREHYKLDQVVASGKTEMEQLMLLRYWVRNQWHTAWGNHPAAWMPPWDALMILESKDQPDCLTMCTHYAAVFTQCCLALGWNARHCILDHHCVAEVYVNELGKWVMMDAGNSAQRADVGLHFERKGVPMSARELHLAFTNKETTGIEACFTPTKLAAKIGALCRPAPPAKVKHPPLPDRVAVKELDKYPVCGLVNYRRYALPPRNNYLDTLLPGELYHGWSEYFYDGYYWVGDSPDEPKLAPEYSLHLDPRRPHDVDWPLNWTQVYLSRTSKASQVRVDLATVTPNFLHFERSTEPNNPAATVISKDGSFFWQLKPGFNRLVVRSVNQWQRKGTPVQVEIEFKRP